MSKGLIRSLERGLAKAKIHKQLVEVRDLAITVDGLTGVGFGTVVAEGLPEGNILFLGGVSYMQFAGSGADANLVDTWEGDYGVGTTPASDATITAGDVDLISSTALAAATAEVSPRTRGEQATGGIFDNTDGSLEININLLVDDAHIDADGVAMTADGEIWLSYVVMGDD